MQVLQDPVPRPLGRSLAAAGAGLLGFLLLLVAVVVTGGTDQVDTAVLHEARSVRTPDLTVAARVVTDLGSLPVLVAVAVLAAALLWRRTRSPIPSVVLLVCVVVTAATVYLAKVAVGRARPATDVLLGTPAADYSFPSGHTTDGTVVWVLTALLLGATLGTGARRLVVLAAVLVAAAVGLSRVYLGYHWGTDVLAGWCLATAVVLTGAFVAERLTGPATPRVLERTAARPPAPPR